MGPSLSHGLRPWPCWADPLRAISLAGAWRQGSPSPRSLCTIGSPLGPGVCLLREPSSLPPHSPSPVLPLTAGPGGALCASLQQVGALPLQTPWAHGNPCCPGSLSPECLPLEAGTNSPVQEWAFAATRTLPGMPTCVSAHLASNSSSLLAYTLMGLEATGWVCMSGRCWWSFKGPNHGLEGTTCSS